MLLSALLIVSVALAAEPVDLTAPTVSEKTVHEEKDGLLVVEAEHFFRQTLTEKRAWYLTSAKHTPKVEPDGDEPHVKGAAGGAYMEILPDTRRTHDDKLTHGENFSNAPGKMAVLHYKVHITNPGRYYVWARIYSTTTEDNGLHVGLNDTWPESGQRLQWTAKNQWFWDSKQRTEKVHTGVPGQIWLDIEKPGEHVITFSMREDGIEFDRFLLTKDKDFKRPMDEGPKVRVRKVDAEN
mgnify:CR=1 FL=1